LGEKTWDWRTRKWNQLAELDNGKVISVHWLRLVRKGTTETLIKAMVGKPRLAHAHTIRNRVRTIMETCHE
jgi:hypothetical protein